MTKQLSTLSIVVLAAALYGCNGTGSGGSTPANTGDTSTLTIAAPENYPVGNAATSIPLVVANNGSTAINNLHYAIGANTTGANVAISTASADACRVIQAGQNCTLQATVPAAPNPGGFTITAEQNSAKKISAHFISMVDSSHNVNSGANGIDFFYPDHIIASKNGSTQFIVTAYVSSANAGAFNTINLIDNNGNPLNYKVLSGNNDGSNLTQDSIVNLLVTVPAGITQLQFNGQTSLNGSPVSTTTNAKTVAVHSAASPTGILRVSPNYFNLAARDATGQQTITLSNSGNGAITNLTFAPQSGLEISENSCGSSLDVGASCSYVVKLNQQNPVSGKLSTVMNYNDGNSNLSATTTVNQIKYVFATRQSWNGDLKTAGKGAYGDVGADNLCNSAAAQGNYTGTYYIGGKSSWRALLDGNGATNDGTDYYNVSDVSGKIFVAKACGSDLTAGCGNSARIRYDENGNSLDSYAMVWTNANSYSGLNGTCTDLTSSNNQQSGLVGSVSGKDWWSAEQKSCDTLNHLYCVQQ